MDVKPRAGIAHGGIDDDQRLARFRPPPRGAHGVDGAGGGPDLGRRGEIAGDDQIDQFEGAIGLHAVEHALEHLDGRRTAAGRAPARMAAVEHGGDQDWLEAEFRQRQGLHRAADAARSHIARKDQGRGHGAL